MSDANEFGHEIGCQCIACRALTPRAALDPFPFCGGKGHPIAQTQIEALAGVLRDFITASVLNGVDGGHAMKHARRKALDILADMEIEP